MTILDHPGHKTMQHEAITAIVTNNGKVPYGVGITPNPYAEKQSEWARRKKHDFYLKQITAKIEAIMEPRFITPPETSELIAAIITITDSRRVLEVGTCTGFTTLHMLRAVFGKEGAQVVSIDARPAHDKEWWKQIQFTSKQNILHHVEGWTPDALKLPTVLEHAPYDLVFVDSDHSVEHTQKELGALWSITRPGTVFLFHDVPEWQTPTNRVPPPVRDYLFAKVQDGTFQGGILHSCEQMDCLDAWGAGYPHQSNPGLGIFVRK